VGKSYAYGTLILLEKEHFEDININIKADFKDVGF
jgi:hypothetical protein